MHLKSCPKLLRSELRLDLGHQQGTPQRRGHGPRVPLAVLSTNTLRCGPVGGAAPARPKGSENAAIAEEDVWSVIRPGHVREKIALFAPDSPHERNAKCSWDVTAKRRRRTSYIALAPPPQSPPCAVTLSLQPAPPSVPQASPPSPQAPPPSENASPLSVVEMVAFLEQRIVTSSPHAKLRSSASITLSRAPPLPAPPLVPVDLDVSPAPFCPADRIDAAPQGEEPESVSVSDMVAKLESQCLRREKQTERRTVGRVLLVEQKQCQPISIADPLQAMPTPSVPMETRKEFVSFYKSDKKLKVTSCFSTDAEAKDEATPTLPERSNAIGRGRAESPPSSCQSTDKSSHTEVKRERQKTAADLAAILRPVHAEVVAAKLLKTEEEEEEFSVKDAAETEPKAEDRSEAVVLSSVTSNTSPPSEVKPEKSAEHRSLDEPLPGLLFLTPPSNVSVQSQCSPVSLSVNSHSDSLPVLSTSERVVQSEARTEERHHSGSNSDSLVVLSVDLTTHCSLLASPASSSNSDQSEKRKRRCFQSSASVCDSSPIRTGSQELTGQSEQRKAKSDSNLSRSCLDFVLQSETSKSSSVQSDRSCLTVTKASLDQTSQSLNSGTSFSQLEKRKSCPVTASELSVQSEASIELLPLESQSQRRRLNRIAQSEKRRSCPVMVSDWSNSQDFGQSQTLKASLDTSQSEQRLSCGSDQSEARPSGSVLRSASDVGVSERRRRRKCARAFSMCEGAGRVSEDFLLMRRRVQSLLEPRSSPPSLLSLLPHHLLLQILLLLPTRALAALKCTCHYMRLVIDTYDPRPLDALWVCDPRYRDDPCKQCKRRHRRGDVSLCRWHHKPFCQAMPYGPGYWMCCHGKRRDAPGCNVGLHDNRWVPAHHSINAPIYRQRPREEDET